MSRTPKGLPEQLAIVLTYQCKLFLFLPLLPHAAQPAADPLPARYRAGRGGPRLLENPGGRENSLYQIRTDTNYVKGSRTTIILKDL